MNCGNCFRDRHWKTSRLRLLLIAPAMTFHSSNADLIRYFSPEIEIERIGVNSDWRKSLRVVLRLTGSRCTYFTWRRPMSFEGLVQIKKAIGMLSPKEVGN